MFKWINRLPRIHTFENFAVTIERSMDRRAELPTSTFLPYFVRFLKETKTHISSLLLYKVFIIENNQ